MSKTMHFRAKHGASQLPGFPGTDDCWEACHHTLFKAVDRKDGGTVGIDFGDHDDTPQQLGPQRIPVFPVPRKLLPKVGLEDSEGGRYINPITKEELTGQTFHGGSIAIQPDSKAHFHVEDAGHKTSVEPTTAAHGPKCKINLFRSSAGWHWHDDTPADPDNFMAAPKKAGRSENTIVCVESRGQHHYCLKAHFHNPLTLATYPNQPSEPRLRPTTNGEVGLGNHVGHINVRGRLHPVHDVVTVGAHEPQEGGLFKSVDGWGIYSLDNWAAIEKAIDKKDRATASMDFDAPETPTIENPDPRSLFPKPLQDRLNTISHAHPLPKHTSPELEELAARVAWHLKDFRPITKDERAHHKDLHDDISLINAHLAQRGIIHKAVDRKDRATVGMDFDAEPEKPVHEMTGQEYYAKRKADHAAGLMAGNKEIHADGAGRIFDAQYSYADIQKEYRDHLDNAFKTGKVFAPATLDHLAERMGEYSSSDGEKELDHHIEKYPDSIPKGYVNPLRAKRERIEAEQAEFNKRRMAAGVMSSGNPEAGDATKVSYQQWRAHHEQKLRADYPDEDASMLGEILDMNHSKTEWFNHNHDATLHGKPASAHYWNALHDDQKARRGQAGVDYFHNELSKYPASVPAGYVSPSHAGNQLPDDLKVTPHHKPLSEHSDEELQQLHSQINYGIQQQVSTLAAGHSRLTKISKRPTFDGFADGSRTVPPFEEVLAKDFHHSQLTSDAATVQAHIAKRGAGEPAAPAPDRVTLPNRLLTVSHKKRLHEHSDNDLHDLAGTIKSSLANYHPTTEYGKQQHADMQKDVETLHAHLESRGVPIAKASSMQSTFRNKLAAARGETNHAPTLPQKEAGNYRKGRVSIHGLTIAIENPKGSYRRGQSPSGQKWSIRMKSDYGYFTRNNGWDRTPYGKDGDAVDVLIGPHPHSEVVYIVDQVYKGKFDEHKVVLGAVNEEEARNVYLDNYTKGWSGLGAITAMTMPHFKEWLRSADKKKPVAWRAV